MKFNTKQSLQLIDALSDRRRLFMKHRTEVDKFNLDCAIEAQEYTSRNIAIVKGNIGPKKDLKEKYNILEN